MKKLSIICLFLSAVFAVAAQKNKEEKSEKYKKLERNLKYTKGYIINFSGEKINGLIKMKSGEARQFTSVKFVHYSGDIISYYPSQINGFGYYSKKFTVIGSSFYQILQTGKRVELLRNVSIKVSPAVMLGVLGAGAGSLTPGISISENETMYLRNSKSQELTKVRKITFKALCLEYFSDCQSVIDKIDSREYRFKDLDKIVKTFNYCDLENWI